MQMDALECGAASHKRLKNTGNEIRFVAVTVAITSLLGIISSATAVFFMDHLLDGRNKGLMVPFFLFITVFTHMECIAALIRSIYAFRISGRYAALENTSYFWHVLHLPMRFFSQRMAGDIELRRASSAQIANYLVNTFVPLFVNMIMLIFYFGVMLKYSVPMTLIGLLSVLLNIFITYKAGQKRANVMRVMLTDAAKLSSATVSGIEMRETIKSSGAENGFFRKWAGYQAGVNTQNVEFTLLQVRLGKLPQLVIELTGNLLLEV